MINKDIPDYRESYLNEKVSRINDIEQTSADGVFSFVGYFYGHIQKDTDAAADGVTIVSTTCDAIEDSDLEIRNSRTVGSVSEQAFDVFTVDRINKRIYATRIGSGENRIIRYE